VMAVNLRGTFVGCRIAGAHLRARGCGRIVNLSSFAGLHPSRASGLHYAASKAVVLWLASDAAGYVTGETIEVNGGRAMR